MKIEVIKVEQTQELLAETMKHCWGVESNMNKEKLFACNDSILEIPEYYIFATVPRSVALQMETHKKKHGCYVWLESARPDLATARTDKPYARDTEVNTVMKLTARAIKEISHYRMCEKAEAPTRRFMQLLKACICEMEPALAKEMVPMCVFRGGICTEFNSCKKNTKNKNNTI